MLRKWENRAAAQLGLAAFYDGNTDQAALKVATAVQTAKQPGDVGAEIGYRSAVGLGLSQSQMYAQSLPYFDSALKLASETPELGYPYLTQEGRLIALLGLKRHEDAERLVEELLTNARQQQRSVHEAIVLGLKASLQTARGEQDAAMATIQRAMAIAESAGMYRALAEMQAMVASAASAAGDLKTATQFAELAAAATRKSGDAGAVPQRLKTLADLMVRSGNITQALDIYDRAEACVDALMGKAPTVGQKTAVLNAASDLYSQHFAVVARTLNRPELAFSIIEQVRGRVTTEILLEGTAKNPKAADAERTVARLRLKLMAARSTREVQSLRDQIFLAEQARWITPGVSILRSSANVRVDMADLQSQLTASEVILEFVLGEPRSYCLVIEKNGSRLVPLMAKGRVEQLIRSYVGTVRSRREDKVQAQALYRALLQPLALNPRYKTFSVIRDGEMFLLPLDALVDPTGSYLVQTRIIQYSFSASSIYLQRRQSATGNSMSRSVLAVGAVPYAGSGLSRGTLTRGGTVANLPDLPSSAEELLTIRNALGTQRTTLLTGTHATEAAFKRSRLEKYGVIHLAVHGIADPTFADRGALILLSDPAAGEDGYLQSAEIAQLDLDGSTVILSACDTGVGPLQGQEGISNISRAFLIAGARSVVASVWAVDDNSSLFRELSVSLRKRIRIGTRYRPHWRLYFASRESMSSPTP